MIQIQNTDAITAIRDGAKLSLSEGFPQNLLPNVQPVMDMTPNFHRFTNVVNTRTSSGEIWPAPSDDKSIYITYLAINAIKAAGDAGTNIAVTCTIGGATKTLLYSNGITLTAEKVDIVLPLMYPIKCDKGTAVSVAVTGAWTAARVIAGGYEV